MGLGPRARRALADPDVVCGVHHGLIGGALGAGGARTDLEPFAVPGACVVRVGTAVADAAAVVGQP